MQEVKIPSAFKELAEERHTFFFYFGGRGGSKTWSIATVLLLKAVEKKIKVMCCREIWESIEKSVWSILVQRIHGMGLESEFTVTNKAITCTRTGSQFLFAGLYRNVESIKSIPGLTHTWVNEASTVCQESLDLLMPTSIREEKSQIIFEWNPRYEDDPVQVLVSDPPPNSFVKKISWRDNPFISSTMMALIQDDYARRPMEARHKWDGELKHYGVNVWPEFDPKIHVKDFNLNDLKDHRVFMALDPHTSFYSAAIWAIRWKINDEYRTWICHEWPTFSSVNAYYSDIRKTLHWQGTVKDLATEFYATETGLKVSARYIDTRFAKGFGSTQTNLINSTTGIVQDFAKKENGGMLFLLPQEIHIDNAKDTIRKDMEYNKLLPIGPLNEPRLYVSPSCKNVIRAFKHHRYEEDSEKETETYKDFSDCVKQLYAGTSEYRWSTQSTYKPNITPGSSWMG